MRVKEKRGKAGLKFNIHKAKIMVSGPITSWKIEGKRVAAVTYFIWGAPKSLWTVTVDVTFASWKESNGKPSQCVEKQRRYSADKGLYSQGYGLSSGHVWM